jgi:hypothetical protein
MNWPIKIQGRLLAKKDVDEIRKLIKGNPLWHRTRLSREICSLWNWHRPDGQIKDMACRELLRKVESLGLIILPPKQRSGPVKVPAIKTVNVNRNLLSCRLSDVKPVKIIDARSSSEYDQSFNYLIKEFHYLSFKRPVGQNMKYLIVGSKGRLLGCILFGAAAWKSADRDIWIGWSMNEREQNLGLICNNTRFLILPWDKIPHLASHALGACLKRLSEDWKHRYGTEIVLVETFVDTSLYSGTCYKAANWQKIGQTKGRGRQDRNRKNKVSIKDILVFPLHRNFRNRLIQA